MLVRRRGWIPGTLCGEERLRSSLIVGLVSSRVVSGGAVQVGTETAGGRREGRGVEGGAGGERGYSTLLHIVTTGIISSFRWAAMRAILTPSLENDQEKYQI